MLPQTSPNYTPTLVYLAWVLRTINTHPCAKELPYWENILFTKPGNAGHGVTFDMSCMQIIQYRIFMSWV